MADSGLSSMILTIAALTVAALISATILSLSVSLSSSIFRVSDSTSEALLTEFTIIHLSKVSSSSTDLTVYVCNTGEISIHQSTINVFYDGEYALYNGSTASLNWTIGWPGQISPDTKFDPSELMKILIKLPSSETVGTGSHSVMISAKGFTNEYWFST